MKHVRPSYLAMALTTLAGVLIADPAYACPPCGPMMAPVSAAPPSVRPPTPPSVTVPNVGNIGSAINAGRDAVSSAKEGMKGNTVRANRDGVDAANEFIDVKTKIKAKNTKATDKQINDAAIMIMNNRRKEAKAKAYREGTARENAETNRIRAEQNARENFNPNAEVYNEGVRTGGGYGSGMGITKQEKKEWFGHKTMPGKPTGAENP